MFSCDLIKVLMYYWAVGYHRGEVSSLHHTKGCVMLIYLVPTGVNLDHLVVVASTRFFNVVF